MAIAWDASSAIKVVQVASSFSWSHTAGSASNMIAIVGLGTYASSVTSITYNGVAMTQACSGNDGGSSNIYIFYLLNPPSGTSTISVTLSSTQYATAASVTLSGVDQVTPVNATNTTNDSTDPYTISVTTTAANCWLVNWLHNNSTNIATVTGGSGETLIANGFGGGMSGGGFYKGPVSSGSNSTSDTWGLDRAFMLAIAAFNEASGGGSFQPAWAVNSNIFLGGGVR